jgi:FixJ family two-component response regulator
MSQLNAEVQRHVILVDDNPDVRLHLGDLLSQMGYSVETVGDPRSLLTRLHWPTASVVLLDMRMPEVSGLDVQEGLSSLVAHVPVVFISGDSLPQEAVQAMKGGAVDFLIKPFGADALRSALNRAFGQADLTREVTQRRQHLQSLYAGLSPRERRVLPLLLRGHSNKSAGEYLSLQADTIKKHRAAIYEKFMVPDLSALMALFHGIERPGDPWE